MKGQEIASLIIVFLIVINLAVMWYYDLKEFIKRKLK
jgi:hypothetical protein